MSGARKFGAARHFVPDDDEEETMNPPPPDETLGRTVSQGEASSKPPPRKGETVSRTGRTVSEGEASSKPPPRPKAAGKTTGDEEEGAAGVQAASKSGASNQARHGAHRVIGIDGNQDEEETVEEYDEEQHTTESPPPSLGLSKDPSALQAELVDPEEEKRVMRDEILKDAAVAEVIPPSEVAEGRRILDKKRRIIVGVTILLALVILAVVLGVLLPPRNKNETTPTAASTIQCTDRVQADGSIGCIAESYPTADYNTNFFGCPDSPQSVLECSSCVISDKFSLEKCTSCTVCADTVAWECTNLAGCAIHDCDDNCFSDNGGSGPTTPPAPGPSTSTPAPTASAVECNQAQDGSLVCVLEDFPTEDFIVEFSCPSTADSLLECTSCNIVSTATNEACNSCTVCATNLAFDCSNIASGECAITNCNGDCIGA